MSYCFWNNLVLHHLSAKLNSILLSLPLIFPQQKKASTFNLRFPSPCASYTHGSQALATPHPAIVSFIKVNKDPQAPNPILSPHLPWPINSISHRWRFLSSLIFLDTTVLWITFIRTWCLLPLHFHFWFVCMYIDLLVLFWSRIETLVFCMSLLLCWYVK